MRTPTAFQAFLARWRAVWRPAMYHGHGRKRDFFEGWYFKFADSAEQDVWAVIPGVFLASSKVPGEESHAFVQTLNGRSGESHYHRYPISEFQASTKEFDLRIGPNRFRIDSLHLKIDRPEQTMAGELAFRGISPWPVTPVSPGIMGWFAYVPFMECYHGVLSLDHEVSGRLRIGKRETDFSAGRGYIEKDWGNAFPRGWVWMQTNHFAEAGTCLTASVARIPWLGTAFPGFIAGLWHRGRLFRFATYTGAALTRLAITDTNVHVTLEGRRYRLELDAKRSKGGLLHAPFRAAMVQRLVESLTAEVSVRLLDRRTGEELFSGCGRNAGLEVGGETDSLATEK
jgi:tocopherol cyclase